MKVDKQVYSDALRVLGPDNQINQAIEEMAELTVSINHWRRGKIIRDQVCEEVADVLIMMQQMMIVFGEDDVKKSIVLKKTRLREEIDRRVWK